MALAGRFSGEDLMRAFDVLTKAEDEIGASLQPRYHLEMALLVGSTCARLVPMTELIQTMDKGARPRRDLRAAAPDPLASGAAPPTVPRRRARAAEAGGLAATLAPPTGDGRPRPKPRRRRRSVRSALKDAFLGEVQRRRSSSTAPCCAGAADRGRGRSRRVHVRAAAPGLRQQLEQNRDLAGRPAPQVAGRKMTM